MENENERAEKLRLSIEETDEEIENLQLVIQTIDDTIPSIKDTEVKRDFLDLIAKYEKQMEFLEELKTNDEETLNLFI